MGGRREADQQKARIWIAEAGQRSGPIVLAGEASRRMARGFFAPPDEPWAARALDDLRVDRVELAN